MDEEFQIKENELGYLCVAPTERINEQKLKDMVKLVEEWMWCDEIGETLVPHYHVYLRGRMAKETVELMQEQGWLTDIKNVNKAGEEEPREEIRKYLEKGGIYERSWKEPTDKYRDAELRPWQSEVVEMILKQNEREILFVRDPLGNTGKSYLMRHLEAKYQAMEITGASMRELTHCAYAKTAKWKKNGGIRPILMLNIQRGREVSLTTDEAMFLEKAKDGRIEDHRYEFRECTIENPAIVVFTNDKKCNRDTLSKDRWREVRVSETDIEFKEKEK